MEWRAHRLRECRKESVALGGEKRRSVFLDDDVLVSGNRRVAWKLDLRSGAVTRARQFDASVAFLEVIYGVNGKQFVLCAFHNGKVLIWAGERPHETILEIDRTSRSSSSATKSGGLAGHLVSSSSETSSGVGNTAVTRGNMHFSVGRSNKQGTFVLASLGLAAANVLEVVEVDLATKGWNSLLLDDFANNADHAALVRCITAAHENCFGLVASATAEVITLYDHKGSLCSVRELGVGSMVWQGNLLVSLSGHTGQLARWMLVPSKEKRKMLPSVENRRLAKRPKLALQEVPNSRKPLTRFSSCTSTSLAVFPGWGILFALCSVAGKCTLFKFDDTGEEAQELDFGALKEDIHSCLLCPHPRFSTTPELAVVLNDATVFLLRRQSPLLEDGFHWCVPNTAPLPRNVEKQVKGLSASKICLRVDVLDSAAALLLVDTVDSSCVIQVQARAAELKTWEPKELRFQDLQVRDIALLDGALLAILSSSLSEVHLHDMSSLQRLRTVQLPFLAKSLFRSPMQKEEEILGPQVVCELQEPPTPPDTLVVVSLAKEGETPPSWPFHGSSFMLGKGSNALYKVTANDGSRELFANLAAPSNAELSLVAMTCDVILYVAADRPGSVLIRPLPSRSVPSLARSTSVESSGKGEGLCISQQSVECLFSVPPIGTVFDPAQVFAGTWTPQAAPQPQYQQEQSILFEEPESGIVGSLHEPHPRREIDSAGRWWVHNLGQASMSFRSHLSGMESERPSIASVSTEEPFLSTLQGFGVSSENHVVGYWRFQLDDGAKNPLRDLSHSSPPSVAEIPSESSSPSPSRSSASFVVDTVSATCTSLDPGDEDLVFPPQAFSGALRLYIPSLRPKHAWCLEFWFRIHKDSVRDLIQDFVTLQEPGIFELGRWYHLALVLSQPPERKLTLFVDGDEYVEEQSFSARLSVGAPPLFWEELEEQVSDGETCFTIMADAAFGDAEFTECRVWNTARTQNDIDGMKDTCLELAELKRKKLMVKIN